MTKRNYGVKQTLTHSIIKLIHFFWKMNSREVIINLVSSVYVKKEKKDEHL